MSDLKKKPHAVTVTITSESDGVLNQEVICREYASTTDELIAKNHIIADAVAMAVNEAMKEMSGGGKKGK